MGGMVISKNAFNKDHFKDGANIKEDYEIGKLVSSSTFGEVHSCTNHRSKTKRMVKIVLKDVLATSECERLRDETRVMKSMDHPNMVTCYDVY